MLRQTGSKMCIFVLALVAFVTLAVAKPPPLASPWATLKKPAFSRSLGPPFAAPEMGSITVPYIPKSSLFFPKFVDPKTMISKKTDMLSHLFGGLGTVDDTGRTVEDFFQYPSEYPQSQPILYTPITDGDIQARKEFTSAEEIVGKEKIKRGAFGPGVAKFDTPDVSLFPKLSSKLSSFTPKFSPARPSGLSFTGFPPKFGPGFFDTSTTTLRRRRSIVETEDVDPKALKPSPAYAGLSPIAEEPDSFESKLQNLYDSTSSQKEMVPRMFSPFGPFSPYAAVTDIPIPKSTIVPADFWMPSSIIPGPTEYTDKVSTFLTKLFDSLPFNKTAPIDDGTSKPVLARSLSHDPIEENIVKSRSIEDIKTIAAAKDSIVDSILSELSVLKTDMISTLNDLIVYQKTASVVPGTKKPFKPPSPFAAFFAPPTLDPILPFKQRMTVLSKVFDMLTGLQKNITLAVQDAISSSTDTQYLLDTNVTQTKAVPAKTNHFLGGNLNTVDDPAENLNAAAISSLNMTLFDVIKSRLAKLDNTAVTDYNKPIVTNDLQGKIVARTLPKYPTTFWATYPEADTVAAKRDVQDDDYEIPEDYENHSDHNRDQYKRLVHMQMHQGYQSMPPGTIESVQAGGGSIPGHQGGGIKLLDQQQNDEDHSKWSEWAEYFRNQYKGRKNHHNHR